MFVKRDSLIQLKKPITPSVIPIAYSDAMTPLERYVCDELRYLGDGIRDLRDVTLTRNGLHEVGVVFDVRRGIFLPSTTILRRIGHVKSTDIRYLIGQTAPDISPL